MNFIHQILSILIILILFDYTNCENEKHHNRRRWKRGAYELSDGWDYLMSDINPSFQCVNDGYYADVANGCQLYHVCNSVPTVYGKPIMDQHTFICPNQTMFDQSLLVCNHFDQSIPCESSPDFFYLNGGLGVPDQNFLYNEDMDRRHNYITGGNNFGDRILKDAAPPSLPSPPVSPVKVVHRELELPPIVKPPIAPHRDVPIAHNHNDIVDRSPIRIISGPKTGRFDYDNSADYIDSTDRSGDYDDDDYYTIKRL